MQSGAALPLSGARLATPHKRHAQSSLGCQSAMRIVARWERAPRCMLGGLLMCLIGQVSAPPSGACDSHCPLDAAAKTAPAIDGFYTSLGLLGAYHRMKRGCA